MPERRKNPKKRVSGNSSDDNSSALILSTYKPPRPLVSQPWKKITLAHIGPHNINLLKLTIQKRRKPTFQQSMEDFLTKKDEESNLPLTPKSIPESTAAKQAEITIIDDEDEEQIEEINQNINDQGSIDKNSNEYKVDQVMAVCGVSKEIAIEALERNDYDLIETFQDL